MMVILIILIIMPFIIAFVFVKFCAKNFTNIKIDLCLILYTIVKGNDYSLLIREKETED